MTGTITHYRCGRCTLIYMTLSMVIGEEAWEEEREGLCEHCMTDEEKRTSMDAFLEEMAPYLSPTEETG